MYLDNATFLTVIDLVPLFAMDLVVMNEHDEILLGKRLNRPAKNFWFVPGGRVYKNESLKQAFKRLTLDELGLEVEMQKTRLLGIFEHFYEDNVFGEGVSTHYINAPHFFRIKKAELVDLPLGSQHESYQWLKLGDIVNQADVHENTKAYLAYI